jgi:CelD/BcsL family acetyltransferase involved in cellulose biosynthesis
MRAAGALDALESRWPAAATANYSPAASFGWICAAQAAFAEAGDMQVLAIERGGRIAAAAALVAARRRGVWRWMPPGAELGEPLELAAKDQPALRELAQTLVAFGQPIVLDRIVADSPVVNELRRAAWGRAMIDLQRAAPSRSVRLDESWTRPARHLPPLAQRLLTRAARRAERIGLLTVEIHTPDLRDLPGLLDVAFAAETERAGAMSEEMLALRLSRAIFFRQYAEAACAEGILRIGVLRIGDRVAAVQVGVESGDAFWLLTAGESSRFARCQPGQLLAVEMFSYAAQSNLQSFELWGTPQAWMRSWPLVERPCTRLSLYPISLRGAAALATDVGAKLADRIRRIQPAARRGWPKGGERNSIA